MKTEKNWKSISSYCFVAFCAFIMSLNTFNNPFHIGYTDTDSSVFNYVARVILRGGMPYRDTFDHKGPLIYLIDALGLLINEQAGVWLMEVIAILVTFLYAYKIARLLNCGYLSSCAVVAVNILTLSYFFQGGNLVEEYACTFITLSLYLFLKFFLKESIKNYELILCGASFAAVCLLRINMTALWMVMCVGVLIDRIKKEKAKDIAIFILWFLAGAVLLAAPIIIWLLKNDAFWPFIDDYFVFNFMYSSDAERASAANVLSSIFFFAHTAPMVISIPVLIFFCLNEKSLHDWLSLVSIIVSIVLMCISGQWYGHYGMILCPLVTYSNSRLFSKLEVHKETMNNRKKAIVYLSLASFLILLFGEASLDLTKSFAKAVLRYNPLTESHQIADIVRENTNYGDKITVCGNRDIIYLLSDRDSVSKYSYQSPIAKVNPQIREEYLAEVRSNEAKMIIIADDSFLYDDMQAIIKNEYLMIAAINNTEIYLRQ